MISSSPTFRIIRVYCPSRSSRFDDLKSSLEILEKKWVKKMIFITGGCRSGKSRYALDYANQHFSKKLYLATCEVLDEEMAQRVENHKKMRGPEWQTVEEPIEIVDKIRQYGNEVEVILMDCITLWLSNLLIKWNDDPRDDGRSRIRLIDTIKQEPNLFHPCIE